MECFIKKSLMFLVFLVLFLVLLLPGCSLVSDIKNLNTFEENNSDTSNNKNKEDISSKNDNNKEAVLIKNNEEVPQHEKRGFNYYELDEYYKLKNKRMVRDDIMPGMTEKEVIEVWGEPSLIQVAGKIKYKNTRWVYNDDLKYNNGRIVYFENGKVAGWEEF